MQCSLYTESISGFNGVFILSDSETDRETDEKMGCIELCRGICTAQSKTPTQILIGFCANLSVHCVPLTTNKNIQKKSAHCSSVLVVTELVVSRTQCICVCIGLCIVCIRQCERTVILLDIRCNLLGVAVSVTNPLRLSMGITDNIGSILILGGRIVLQSV